jgi:hypothetical protein
LDDQSTEHRSTSGFRIEMQWIPITGDLGEQLNISLVYPLGPFSRCADVRLPTNSSIPAGCFHCAPGCWLSFGSAAGPSLAIEMLFPWSKVAHLVYHILTSRLLIG